MYAKPPAAAVEDRRRTTKLEAAVQARAGVEERDGIDRRVGGEHAD